jgi:flavin reductase (DIM6/NTAB) family NADH-FMN oxidoreductase RutF
MYMIIRVCCGCAEHGHAVVLRSLEGHSYGVVSGKTGLGGVAAAGVALQCHVISCIRYDTFMTYDIIMVFVVRCVSVLGGVVKPF